MYFFHRSKIEYVSCKTLHSDNRQLTMNAIDSGHSGTLIGSSVWFELLLIGWFFAVQYPPSQTVFQVKIGVKVGVSIDSIL